MVLEVASSFAIQSNLPAKQLLSQQCVDSPETEYRLDAELKHTQEKWSEIQIRIAATIPNCS